MNYIHINLYIILFVFIFKKCLEIIFFNFFSQNSFHKCPGHSNSKKKVIFDRNKIQTNNLYKKHIILY